MSDLLKKSGLIAGNGRKAVIAMSGGVDSSVAAALMTDAGYECMGATMRLMDHEFDIVQPDSCTKTCCSQDDVEDARAVAFKLGMPFHAFNFTDDFKRDVIDHFIDEYEGGKTPNPCIDCNRYLKFGKLWQQAKVLGFDTIVTGHYAIIEQNASGRYLLKKGADESKDQTYVLYSLTQEQLAHTLFPLGRLDKESVREFAEERGFINARKHDSQDICFVPDGDYVKFMESYTGKVYEEGDFIDLEGNVIGRHKGAVRYTLGQRKGLGLAMGEPVYVCEKSMEDNTVTVGSEGMLFARSLAAVDVNWIAYDEPEEKVRVSACTRYHQKPKPAWAWMEDGRLKVCFDEPVRAMTPGQAVVMYDGDIVVGGGTIAEVIK